ncbi:uncharacterized protein Dwil_GK14588 [Drosophila willistoni]|uniref:LRRCT domain-containing protein n=1 Tax=Drosophila willistoni TaxID=7260 RepID=B4MWU2_DROWI|nr:uncharacterized protein Dwil_GK14588 [Drosophila willistoni]
MSNLKDIEVRGEGTIRFRNDTFQNNTQLEKIVFLNLNLLNLNLATFSDLTHLKELIFVNCTLDSNEFLRSITLENNLETLDYENEQKFDVKYLESYRKLHTITLRNVDQSYYFQEFINTNVTAFLCSNYPVICYFNFGINGKRCPSSCTCSKIDHIFTINCARQGLRKIPELPIPIIGDASLHFEGNGLTQLPNNSLEGYDGLRELHLAYNSLTHLHLDQLPFNLKVLDIRQNHLTGLDDNVTQFISTLKDVQLSENPWQCSCKYIKFLEHLSQDYPSEYVAALRRCSGQEYCPDPCTCCKEEVSQKFITNCDKQ